MDQSSLNVTILLPLYVFVFDRETCGVLVLRPGIEPEPPALEGQVLTTGPSEKSPAEQFK